MTALVIYFFVALLFTMFWLRSGKSTYSMSYYALLDKYKILFTFFCWGLALSAIAIFQSIWIGVGAIGIIIVGVASDFVVKEVYEYIMPDGSVVERERRVKTLVYRLHMWGTYIGVGSLPVGLWVSHGLWYLSTAFVAAALALYFKGGYRRLGWVEFAAITTTFIAGIIVIQ